MCFSPKKIIKKEKEKKRQTTSKVKENFFFKKRRGWVGGRGTRQNSCVLHMGNLVIYPSNFFPTYFSPHFRTKTFWWAWGKNIRVLPSFFSPSPNQTLSKKKFLSLSRNLMELNVYVQPFKISFVSNFVRARPFFLG